MMKQLEMFAPRPKEEKSGLVEKRGTDPAPLVLQPQPLPKWATDEWFSREDPEPALRRTRCELCGKYDVHPKPLIVWLGGLVHVGCHREYVRQELRQDAIKSGEPCCVVCGEPYPVPRIPTFDGMIHVCCQDDYEHGGAGSADEDQGEEGGGGGGEQTPAEGGQRGWPVCVICGSSGGHNKIWVESMYELVPGVHRGVCHEQCFREWKKRER